MVKVVVVACFVFISFCFQSNSVFSSSRKSCISALLVSAAMLFSSGIPDSKIVRADDRATKLQISDTLPLAQDWIIKREEILGVSAGGIAFERLWEVHEAQTYFRSKFIERRVGEHTSYVNAHRESLMQMHVQWHSLNAAAQKLYLDQAIEAVQSVPFKTDEEFVRFLRRSYRYIYCEKGFALFELMGRRLISEGRIFEAIQIWEDAMMFGDEAFRRYTELQKNAFVTGVLRAYVLLGWHPENP